MEIWSIFTLQYETIGVIDFVLSLVTRWMEKGGSVRPFTRSNTKLLAYLILFSNNPDSQKSCPFPPYDIKLLALLNLFYLSDT